MKNPDALSSIDAGGAPAGGDISAVERSYEQILDMVISFAIRPGERINETELAKRLGVSRTPLREALNRLVTEGFLTVTRAKGFYCREVKPRAIFELYQLRIAVEAATARLAAVTATDEDLLRLETFVAELGDPLVHSIPALVHYDEGFHELIAELSGNHEMLRLVRATNRKIRPVRHIDVDDGIIALAHSEHMTISRHLRRREGDAAAALILKHVARRLDQVDAAVRELYGRIYVG